MHFISQAFGLVFCLFYSLYPIRLVFYIGIFTTHRDGFTQGIRVLGKRTGYHTYLFRIEVTVVSGICYAVDDWEPGYPRGQRLIVGEEVWRLVDAWATNFRVTDTSCHAIVSEYLFKKYTAFLNTPEHVLLLVPSPRPLRVSVKPQSSGKSVGAHTNAVWIVVYSLAFEQFLIRVSSCMAQPSVSSAV